jgi:hypothetical protein
MYTPRLQHVDKLLTLAEQQPLIFSRHPRPLDKQHAILYRDGATGLPNGIH